mgnify:CR=1 FL=1
MLSKIRLYGRLAEVCGNTTTYEAVLNTPVDAIRFLINNFKNANKHISQNNYQIYVGDENIGEEALSFPSRGQEIKIIPVISGSGNVGRILAGVVLIGIAVGVTGGIGILGKPVISATGVFAPAALAGKIGMLLVLSGIAGLLTPTPEIPEDEGDPTKSFNFSGVQNNANAGTAIPICYGHVICGSIPVSAKLTTNDIED